MQASYPYRTAALQSTALTQRVAEPASAAVAYDLSAGTQLADAGARAPNYGAAGGRRPAGGYAQCS